MLESQINNEHKFVVGEIIRMNGKMRIRRTYRTREEIEIDYANWFEYSSKRTESEQTLRPILPFEDIGGGNYEVMLNFLAEFHGLNENIIH